MIEVYTTISEISGDRHYQMLTIDQLPIFFLPMHMIHITQNIK